MAPNPVQNSYSMEHEDEDIIVVETPPMQQPDHTAVMATIATTTDPEELRRLALQGATAVANLQAQVMELTRMMQDMNMRQP